MRTPVVARTPVARTSVVTTIGLVGLLFATVGGCTYVSPAAVQEKVQTLDEDSDGVAKKDGDCDDFDANETPGEPEIPYDGYDNDCGGDGDTVDVDGDGFPFISKAEWLLTAPTEGGEPKHAWPQDVRTGDDPADLDCDDEDDDVHPGAEDIFYDGVDSDCDGANDFDQDGDTYIPSQYSTDLEAYNTTYGYTHAVLGGDCDDSVNEGGDANPGIDASNDEWYDGIDNDCATNNDFDQDGDGYTPDEYEDAFDTYVAKYSYGSELTFVGGDCLDIDMALTGDAADGSDCAVENGGTWSALASCVNPGATDTPYDGIDADCASDNDFDQDVDGFMPNGTDIHFGNYQVDWNLGSLGAGAYNDCEDTDETRHPDALEMFGDAVDQDCDGGANTTPFEYDAFTFTNPGRVLVGATEDHYLVTTLADEYVDGFAAIRENVGLTLAFENDDDSFISVPWYTTTGSLDPVGPGIDLETNGSEHTTTMADYRDSVLKTFVVVNTFEYTPPSTFSPSSIFANTSGHEFFDTIDLRTGLDGEIWMVGCHRDQLLFGWKADGFQFAQEEFSLNNNLTGDTYGSVCWMEPTDLDQADVHVCDGANGCRTFEFTASDVDAGVVEAATSPYSSEHITSARTTTTELNGDFTVLTNASGGIEVESSTSSWSLLPGIIATDADVTMWDGKMYLAVVGDSGAGTEITLAFGDPDTALTQMTIPMEDDGRDLTPISVGLHADTNYLVIGASATNSLTVDEDAVGWLFMSWAP